MFICRLCKLYTLSAVFLLYTQSLFAKELSWHEKLQKIPVDFTMEFQVESLNPENVIEERKQDIYSHKYFLSKKGKSYKIRISDLDPKKGDKFSLAFDGVNYYYYTHKTKLLRVGSNPEHMSNFVNGCLAKFPLFVIPMTEAHCGAPEVNKNNNQLVFTTAEKRFQFVFSVSPDTIDLVDNDVSVKVPKMIKNHVMSGDNFDIVTNPHSYVIKTITASIIPKDNKIPNSFFKIAAAEAKRIVDYDMDFAEIQK